MSDEVYGGLLGLGAAVVIAFGVTASLLARAATRAGTCPWYVRGWHRASRQADIQFVWQALRDAARANSSPRAKVVEGWRVHQTLPGQDHWRCPCGRVATALFEATVVVPYLEHRDRLRV